MAASYANDVSYAAREVSKDIPRERRSVRDVVQECESAQWVLLDKIRSLDAKLTGGAPYPTSTPQQTPAATDINSIVQRTVETLREAHAVLDRLNDDF